MTSASCQACAGATTPGSFSLMWRELGGVAWWCACPSPTERCRGCGGWPSSTAALPFARRHRGSVQHSCKCKAAAE